MAAVGFLVAFWFVYDTVCRVFGFQKNGELIVAGLMGVAYALSSMGGLANLLEATNAAAGLPMSHFACEAAATVFAFGLGRG